jgi:hypothetical protein
MKSFVFVVLFLLSFVHSQNTTTTSSSTTSSPTISTNGNSQSTAAPTIPVGALDRILNKNANNLYCRQFSSSFETLSDFQYVTNSTSGSMGQLSQDIVHSGKYSYQAIIIQPETNPHTQYAAFIPSETSGGSFNTPAYIEVWIYLDVTVPAGNAYWFTLGEISTDGSRAPVSLTLNSAGQLGLYNVPTDNYIGYVYQNTSITMPQKQWVNITMYIDFSSTVGYVALWQDGTVVALANVQNGDGKLSQVHFGMVASSNIASGTLYNDDLSVKEIIPSYSTCPDGVVGTKIVSVTNNGSLLSYTIALIMAILVALFL